MVNDEKIRVSVTIPKSVCEKIDNLASKSGMSRSQMVAFMAVQGVESYEVVMNFPDELKKLVEKI